MIVVLLTQYFTFKISTEVGGLCSFQFTGKELSPRVLSSTSQLGKHFTVTSGCVIENQEEVNYFDKMKFYKNECIVTKASFCRHSSFSVV